MIALAATPLIPVLATFLPLLTALATLFTVEKAVLAFIILPRLPPNLLAFTAAIPAFIDLLYLLTLRFATLLAAV